MGLPAAFTSGTAEHEAREAAREAYDARVQAAWAQYSPYGHQPPRPYQ